MKTKIRTVVLSAAAVLLAAIPAGAQIIPAVKEAPAGRYMDAAAFALAMADAAQTAHGLDEGGRERDPLARPFTALPRPAYVAASAAGAAGVVMLSRRWRKEGRRWWWVPEAAVMAANAWGIGSSHWTKGGAPQRGVPRKVKN